MEPLPDTHRALIQAFMAHRTLELSEALDIFHKILKVDSEDPDTVQPPNQATLNGVLEEINDTLSHYDLQFKRARDQHTSTYVFTLVNLTSDPHIQLATTHSPEQISFFKRLLDAMFETNNQPQAEVYAVRGTDALNLHKPEPGAARADGVGKDTGLTMKQAEDTLRELVEERWLRKSRAGWYSLTTRALLELQPYISSMYGEDAEEEEEPRPALRTCYACKTWITVGQRCDRDACGIRMHDDCARRWMESVRKSECPECKREWTGNNKVGEKAAARLRKKVRRRSEMPDTSRVDEAEAEEEDAEEEPRVDHSMADGTDTGEETE